MTMDPCPEWKPDLPDLADATSIAHNVTPEAMSYGPLNDLAAYSSNALDGQCFGAAMAQDVDTSVYALAGTTDNLYMMNGTTPTWNVVSKAPAAYSTAQGDVWRFDQFNRTIIATNFGNPIQAYTFGTSTLFADLAAAAPQARFLCTPKNFLMVGGTSDPVGGLNPSRLWWSGNGQPASWPAPGSALAQQQMSDFNDFPGNYGEMTGLVDSLAYADASIFFRHAVWRGSYVGPPDVFDFAPAENVKGTPYPNSIVPIGNMVYYQGEDGAYSFDGAQSNPIGANKFDTWFRTTVNEDFQWMVIGAADVKNKIIAWIFPSVSAPAAGVPDTILLYKYDVDRAAYGNINAEWLARFLTFGTTLDGLSLIGFTNLDTLPASLDSRIWVGGCLQFGGVDTNHKLAFFTGPTLPAQVGTGTAQYTPNMRSYVSSARPIVEMIAGTPTIAFCARDNMMDPQVFGPDVPMDIAGECPQRSDGRYHEARISMQAGDAWTHIVGADVTSRSAGTRGRSPTTTGTG
jgi:hypothetical protein